MAIDFNPPSSVRGMKELERDEFNKTVTIPALKTDAKHCGRLRKGLSSVLLKQPRVKDVIQDKDSKTKKVLLLSLHVKDLDSLTEDERNLVDEAQAELILYDLMLTYEHYTADQVLNAVMPAGEEVTTAFETIGHIAHMNLKMHQLEYKNIIGDVILDKNPSIKTVVNKVNTIEETFRFFHMELLAGEDKMYARLKQHDCIFEFDFSKVYWNSRLQTEHKRIIDRLEPGDVVFDVFAGVGPFAIPAAKKGCKVYANDLNPESYKALNHNAKINKVETNTKTYNMDGREFLQLFLKDDGLQGEDATGGLTNVRLDDNIVGNRHVLMNLPGNAVEFLDVFKDCMECNSNEKASNKNLETIFHCYCFSKSNDPFKDAIGQVENVLNRSITDLEVHHVRNVAPKKAMMCVSFKLHLNVSKEKGHDIEQQEKEVDKHVNSPRGIKRPAED